MCKPGEMLQSPLQVRILQPNGNGNFFLLPYPENGNQFHSNLQNQNENAQGYNVLHTNVRQSPQFLDGRPKNGIFIVIPSELKSRVNGISLAHPRI